MHVLSCCSLDLLFSHVVVVVIVVVRVRFIVADEGGSISG